MEGGDGGKHSGATWRYMTLTVTKTCERRSPGTRLVTWKGKEKGKRRGREGERGGEREGEEEGKRREREGEREGEEQRSRELKGLCYPRWNELHFASWKSRAFESWKKLCALGSAGFGLEDERSGEDCNHWGTLLRGALRIQLVEGGEGGRA